MGTASISHRGSSQASCAGGIRCIPKKQSPERSQSQCRCSIPAGLRCHQDVFYGPDKSIFSGNRRSCHASTFCSEKLFNTPFSLFLLIFFSRRNCCTVKLMYSPVSSTRSFSTGWNVFEIATLLRVEGSHHAGTSPAHPGQSLSVMLE